jgi:hypothetical protein
MSDAWISSLTKKAEPRRTKNREPRSGTARANRRWLRRLVRHQRREIHNKTGQIQTLTNWQAPHLLAAPNPARAKSWLTADNLLISNRTAQIFTSQTDYLKPQTDLDA